MSENILKGEKTDLERQLEELPDLVSDAQVNWGIKKLEREKIEALLHMKCRADSFKYTVGDIKAIINSDDKRYMAMFEEIKAEAQYNRLYEKLMSAKKLAQLRTAY